MESIEQLIKAEAELKPAGSVFFPEDFARKGSPDGVRKALQRLEHKGILQRVAQGIYVRPKKNKYIGEVLPSAEEIAEAIARRDRARTVPTGSWALNALGLSTQVPMNLVLLTDGSPREIRVGKRKIKFKKTTPRNLAAKGEISRLVIQALKAIGKDRVSADDEQRILQMLRKERLEDLQYDISVAPEWIQHIMKKALTL